jgi:hypothetical protein
MGAAHDDQEPAERKPSTDVSEAEAEAVTRNTSAEQIEDVPLVAPTDDDAASSSDAAGEPGDGSRARDDDPAEPGEDRRQLQQGSGQPSPSFGEQQQRVPPAS